MEEQKVLTVVCDGATSSVKLFIDGTLVGSATDFPAKLEQAKEHAVRMGGIICFQKSSSTKMLLIPPKGVVWKVIF